MRLRRTPQTPDYLSVHASGLWDASAGAWRGLVRQLVATEVAGLKPAVIGFTECTRVTPWVPQSWRIFHDTTDRAPGVVDGSDECAIAWDTDYFEAAGPGWTEPLTRSTFRLEDERRRPRVEATCQPLRVVEGLRRAGRVVVKVVYHGPSGIDGGRGLKNNDRAQVAREVIAGRAALKARIRKAYPGCEIDETGDDNIDLRRPWARRLAARAGGLAVWAGQWIPRTGTHGPRLIDGARHTRGLKVVVARVLPRVKPFDHAPIAVAYRIRRRRRRQRR